jgi:group I intron endonuclease
MKFSSSDPGKIYRHVIKFSDWPFIRTFKKHPMVAHCPDPAVSLNQFRANWKGQGGIYKITFRPFRLFSYYGRTNDLSVRLKYHFYNGSKQNNFLGLFLRTFGWEFFTITIVEVCPQLSDLSKREDYYLSTFHPMLNFLTRNVESNTVSDNVVTALTRAKISATLTGRKPREETKAKMSKGRTGSLNHNYGVALHANTLDAAAEANGRKVYAYDQATFTLVNGEPFRSLRAAAKNMPISNSSLELKVDKGIPFKGYYYFTSPQSSPPQK